MSKIHQTAHIDPGAKIGSDVEVGAFTIIHENVVIGDRTKVGSHCELGISTPLADGSPLKISKDSLIRSHSIFYESSIFGDGLVTGHNVNVRENTSAGKNFQIGTMSEIQGDCQIGDYVRFQSNVFVGKKTVIGSFVWIFPYVVLTNDPTPPSNQLLGCIIEDFASIAASSVVLPGVRIGRHSLVAAKACVGEDVPDHMVVAGIPARIMGEAKSITRRDGSDESAYPWIRHFHRGYPDSIVEEWKKKFEDSDEE
ncbi:MAG: N-acetyltransferase [Thiotrichaceae bacterium]|nr:MAG: N-acetyltransferase [Thiotrichaceae bacterium]